MAADIFDAALFGNEEQVHALVEKGVSVNSQNKVHLCCFSSSNVPLATAFPSYHFFHSVALLHWCMRPLVGTRDFVAIFSSTKLMSILLRRSAFLRDCPFSRAWEEPRWVEDMILDCWECGAILVLVLLFYVFDDVVVSREDWLHWWVHVNKDKKSRHGY